jgi:hypothetical protein
MVLVLGLTAASGCTRGKPEMLVCRSVGEDGGCVDRRVELVAGREYTIVVRQGDIPESASLEIARFVNGRATVIGTAPVRVAGDRAFATNPLTLLDTGSYRLTLRDGDRHPIVATNVRVPRPSVWNARPATPAEAARP